MNITAQCEEAFEKWWSTEAKALELDDTDKLLSYAVFSSGWNAGIDDEKEFHATHTTCENCKKEFELNAKTLYNMYVCVPSTGNWKNSGIGVKCPHCNTKKEFPSTESYKNRD